ncbi:transposase [Alkalinema sp. FACHB-956]|uniref:transposase n=1 Tax=Alkalinema sp. FACHB-956 TaxID=2692768 RepID=UPI0016828CB3|nr:transposase [Alkalinema sp. FACHB-956]
MFPQTEDECIKHLEQIRWGGKPQCPYCGSTRSSAYTHTHRYHCKDCFTSYSVTVGTLFHKTHLDLQKWFQAIHLIFSTPSNITVRQLAQALDVNKNTALYMRARIYKCLQEDPNLLRKLTQKDLPHE